MTTTPTTGRPIKAEHLRELVEGPGSGFVPASAMARNVTRYVLAAVRVVIGFTFFWAFLDKLFGLGYATPAAKSWINGGSPTKGFLSSAAGPFAGFYHGLAGTGFANVMFMLALAGIGIALLLGIGTRVAAVSGAILYLMMWSVALPPTANPLLDEHIIGALAVLLLALLSAGDTFGLGRWWKDQAIVRRNPWLI
jgi:thiosulfate dehydrogenase [quinone] large subunit